MQFVALEDKLYEMSKPIFMTLVFYIPFNII